MRYVGVGRRFVAFLVDAVVGSIWTFPFLDIDRSPGYFHAQLRGGVFVGAFLIGILYATVMEAAFGATIGKFATGIRVVRADGTKLDVPSALIRNSLRVIDVLPFAYLLGAILVWASSKKQRLGDRVAKTVVVEASSVGAAPGPGEAPGGSMWTPSPMAPGGITPPPMPPPPPIPGDAAPVHESVPAPDLDPVPAPDPVPATEPVQPPETSPSSEDREN